MKRLAPVLAAALALLAPAAAYAQTSSEPEVRITDVNTSRYEEGGNTTMVVAFVILLWAIPWPGREVGRPLFPTIP